MTALIIGSWLGYSGYNKLPIANPTPAHTQSSDTPDSKTHSTTTPTNNDNSSYQDLPTIPNIQAEPPTRLPNKKAADRVAPLQYQPAVEDMPLSQRTKAETIYETAADRINATTIASTKHSSDKHATQIYNNKVSTTITNSKESQHSLAMPTGRYTSGAGVANATTTISTIDNALLATDQPKTNNNPQLIAPRSLREIGLMPNLPTLLLRRKRFYRNAPCPQRLPPPQARKNPNGKASVHTHKHSVAMVALANMEQQRRTEQLHTTFGRTTAMGCGLLFQPPMVQQLNMLPTTDKHNPSTHRR